MQMIRFPGKIHLITTNQQLENVADEMKSASQLGFDTETRPSFRKGEVYKAALLQLATDKNAYLIRLQLISNFHLLKDVLESESILKVGAAIRDDIKQLNKTFPFEPKRFVELQDVAKKAKLQNLGLRGMAEEVLGAKLSKAAKITNWQAPTLTEAQIMYAATDAWVGLKIYEALSMPGRNA